jgi:hypothetical protein
MGTDRRDEIAASVAAHQDLGPGYERAVAEGLVERIGAEIDQRVATEIDQRVAAELDEYLDCRHLRRARRRARGRPGRPGRPSVLLALGSMAAAVSVTAIVLTTAASSVDYANGGASRSGPGAAAVLLTALIWIIVGVINVAYARRPQQ